MSELGEKMRRMRETDLEHGGHSYTVRIPTEGELEEWAEALAGKRPTPLRAARAFTVGWNLKEIDLAAGGRPVSAEFEADALNEHLSAHPDLATALFAKIMDGIEARKKQAAGDEKK